MSAKVALDASRILISGGRLLVPATNRDGEFDILIEGGKVAAVDVPGSFSGPSSKLDGVRVIDARGKLITPGLIDLHVHLREPGQEWKETILTGTQAAVAGGFTAVVCMPNTMPAPDNAEVARFIVSRAKDANLARVYPMGTITLKRKGEALAPFSELADAGCVAFSDDGAPVSNSLIMRRALEYVKMLGLPLAVHEEDLQLAGDFSMNESAFSLRLGLKGMPGAAEDVMIARDIELARLTGGHVHFCHVSTARAVTLIRRAKEDGIPVTAEVTPHYFTLTEEAIADYDTNAKMSMPLRSQEDVDGVLAGLAEGVLDCIASDHAPHELDSKEVEFDKASFGIIGLQTTLPLTLAKVREGKLSLNRAIESLTASPAKCMKVASNRFVIGDPADLAIIDLDAEMILTKEQILSKSKNTPFMGANLRGLAERVFVEGRQVYLIGNQ